MFLIRHGGRFYIKSNKMIESAFQSKIRYQSKSSEDHIEIPNRIPRSPTAILEALSNTVGDDPTAAHYKYHDDPFLIPMSNIGKRTFAMAQESGRKAAKWIKEEHRNLFQHSIADPPIKQFAPKMVFTEESEVDGDSLRNLINNSEIKDAVFVYNLIKSKNMEVSDELKQSLLELICFYNNEEPLSQEFIEERWFRQGMTGKERQRKTWKDGDLAEKLFSELETKNSKNYASLIRGMCKFHQVERAWALFQEAIEKQIYLDTKTFNSLLSVVSFLKESGELRWELCLDLLQQMNQCQLKPDLGTLNAILSTISTIGNTRLSRGSTLKILREFKALGVEPSLATWYYILIIFCRERAPVSHVICDILAQIEGKEFQIRDSKDTYFFVTAMDVCRNHLHDKQLAKRVNDLLHVGNNYNLIGDSFKESIYYRHYFALLCQTESLEVFMETYELLVPNVYIPEPGIMEEILKAIDTNGGLELVPKMWSDMVIFDHISRESLLIRILKIMSENKPSIDISSHQGLVEKFGNIAYDIFQKVEEQRENRVQKLTFTGHMLGEILLLVSRSSLNALALGEATTNEDNNGWWDKCQILFTKLDKNQHTIPGTPADEAMLTYVEICIAEKSPSQALQCLQYSVENGLNSIEIARKIKGGLTLNEVHLKKVKSLVGEDCLV